jgi:hypothetical protein
MERSFDDERVKEIARSVRLDDPKKHLDLAVRLRELRELTATLRTANLPIPPSALAGAFAPIESSCRILLDCLTPDERGEAIQDLDRDQIAHRLIQWQLARHACPNQTSRFVQDRRIDDLISDYRAVIETIADATGRARQQIKSEVAAGRGGARRSSDKSLHEITSILFDIYYELTNREPAITVDGPTVRFLSLCLPCLGWDLSPSKIRHLIRTVRRKWRYMG